MFLGVISCRVTNAHGQIQSSCTLIVKDDKRKTALLQSDPSMTDTMKSTDRYQQEVE